MSEHQKANFRRRMMKLLKRELLNYKRARTLGIRLYPDPARLPL